MARKKKSAVEFTTRPPAEYMPCRYELYRVPPNGFKHLIVLGHNTEGTFVHWWQGHTRPCLGDPCEACLAGTRKEYRGYLFVQRPSTAEIFVVELTPPTFARIEEVFDMHRTLRGSRLTLTRVERKANGRMMIILMPPKTKDETLPDAPMSAAKFLQRMWRLPAQMEEPPVTDEILAYRVRMDAKMVNGRTD